MTAPSARCHLILLALVLALSPAGAAAQRTPQPDAKALERATQLRHSGAAAEVVAREVLTTWRQSGVQALVILTSVGFLGAEVGRALATEARADAGAASRWLVQAGLPTTVAWAIVREIGGSSGQAVKAMTGSGFSARDVITARQAVERLDTRAYAADLRYAGVGAIEAGDALGAVASSNASNTAAEMLHAGYSVVEVAVMLRDGWGLRDDQVGRILVDENVDDVQVLMAWLDPVYGLSEFIAAKAFESIGGSAEHATAVLKDRGRNPTEVVTILAPAGYGPLDVGDAIGAAFGLPSVYVMDSLIQGGFTYTGAAAWSGHHGDAELTIVTGLRSAGASATENAAALLNADIVTGYQAADFATWARVSGYGCEAVAGALKSAFNQPAELAATALPRAGCAPGETAQALEAVYGPSFAGLALLLVQASFNASALALALFTVNGDPAAVAEAMHAAGSSLNDVASGLRSLNVTPEAVAGALVASFNADALQVATAMKDAGFSQTQVQNALASSFTLALNQILDIIISVFR